MLGARWMLLCVMDLRAQELEVGRRLRETEALLLKVERGLPVPVDRKRDAAGARPHRSGAARQSTGSRNIRQQVGALEEQLNVGLGAPARGAGIVAFVEQAVCLLDCRSKIRGLDVVRSAHV